LTRKAGAKLTKSLNGVELAAQVAHVNDSSVRLERVYIIEQVSPRIRVTGHI
jgi:hypothetical protein